MSEMVARVARALIAEWRTGNSASKFAGDHPADDYFTSEAANLARAAIEAMREPSETMITASDAARAHTGEEYWKAMIDGALKP